MVTMILSWELDGETVFEAVVPPSDNVSPLNLEVEPGMDHESVTRQKAVHTKLRRDAILNCNCNRRSDS